MVITITMEFQQVTTCSRAKNMDWAEQDEIRKAAQVRAETTNEANMERMRQESGLTPTHMEGMALMRDPIWQAMVECKIMLTIDKLLRLIPRF